MACPAQSKCVVAASYTDSYRYPHAMLLTRSRFGWIAIRPHFPPNADSTRPSRIDTVACSSTTSCVATGDYTDRHGHNHSVLVTGSGTSWSSIEIRSPGIVSAIACPAPSTCVGTGSYTDSSGHNQALLMIMGRGLAAAPRLTCGHLSRAAPRPNAEIGPAPSAGANAYVTGGNDGLVVPIDLTTGITGKPIGIGTARLPIDLAITPDGRTAYVSDYGTATVTPIDLTADKPKVPIHVGTTPWGIAIAPDGKTAYVAVEADNTVVPIDVATDTLGAPISVGPEPYSIAIDPDGRSAYVVNAGDNTVTQIDLTIGVACISIPLINSNRPQSIAITPDDKTAYVTGSKSGQNIVTPIDLVTGRPGTPVPLGHGMNRPLGIAITPDGSTAYIAGTGSDGDMVTPISLVTKVPGSQIPAGKGAEGIVITPDGKMGYTVNNISGTITPIDISTNTPEIPINVGVRPDAIAIAG